MRPRHRPPCLLKHRCHQGDLSHSSALSASRTFRLPSSDHKRLHFSSQEIRPSAPPTSAVISSRTKSCSFSPSLCLARRTPKRCSCNFTLRWRAKCTARSRSSVCTTTSLRPRPSSVIDTVAGSIPGRKLRRPVTSVCCRAISATTPITRKPSTLRPSLNKPLSCFGSTARGMLGALAAEGLSGLRTARGRSFSLARNACGRATASETQNRLRMTQHAFGRIYAWLVG